MQQLANDLYWLGVNTYHEARGETQEGQIAVCHVVLNRVLVRKKSIQDIILQSNQFSWTIENAENIPIKEPTAFRNCMKSAAICLEERSKGLSLSGCQYYFNPNIVLPSWAASYEFILRIGRHDFYRDNKSLRLK